MSFSTDMDLVQGNFIGTNATGTQALGNATGVLILGGTSNTVGGTAAGASNLISGNFATGLDLGDPFPGYDTPRARRENSPTTAEKSITSRLLDF